MDRPAMRDAALFLLRAVLGFLFIAHGWQKVAIDGMDETIGSFSTMHVPQPKLSAYITMMAELACGGLLVVGFLTTIAAAVLALVMAGALYFVHLDSGVFVGTGGFEYVLLLITALIMVIVFGSGRASIDGVLTR
ncbi:DoxX family protein [Corynebacterium sp. TAE3-ERU30]|uniref:DoxX family protein n=1 Tax=Corynebacterium sp. TAE3-ERU30 TaxID=2849496 RepID=UPI001C44108B|nr:DoxX family protein [Corynebacterium sp. TAE3-ERU30]MBV7281313.1 DoxX family protein [Corynebacterium sp. TAE3-ERU30]